MAPIRLSTRVNLDGQHAFGHHQARAAHPDPRPGHGDLDPAGPSQHVALLHDGGAAVGHLPGGDQAGDQRPGRGSVAGSSLMPMTGLKNRA